MKVNYAIPSHSKYLFYSDLGILHGFRHLYLGVKGKQFGLTSAERVKHIAFGILKMIPVIGSLVALYDRQVNKIEIKQLDLSRIQSNETYQRGLIHGQFFKDEIRELYTIILTSIRDEIYEESQKLHKNIPADLRREMEGLADGAQVDYVDVLMIHTFLDVKPGKYGCTALAVKKTDQDLQAIAAANHSVKDEISGSCNSISRRNEILKAKDKIPLNILKAANVNDTIHSIVFNPNKRSLQIAVGEANSARESFREFNPFGNIESYDEKVKMVRNLDWPWYFLAQKTLLLTRKINNKKITTVTFPGFLGTLSGMNDDGLSVALCQRGISKCETGIPCTLLFTKLLSNCSTANEVEKYIEGHFSASSVNLVAADQNSAISMELLNGEDNQNEIVARINE